MNQISRELHTVSADPAVSAGAILTVDLDAIRANYQLLSKTLGSARCAGVVKADGYGLGAAKVARALMAEGCDTFFVAHLSEGIALRGAIGAAPVIYVLNGLAPGAEAIAASARLRPVLNSLEQIAAWRDLAQAQGVSLAAALQVDSGMSRMGLAPAEVDVISADASLLKGIEVTLVMSHLACADEPGNPANKMQLDTFRALKAKLPAAPASLANSSGIFLGPEYHFDLARPGAALYGINPVPGRENPLRQVVSLSAKVIQTRMLQGGEGIGYGHIAEAKPGMRLATIAIGYADGWHRRSASAAWFKDVRLPFVGRVSMDSIIVDISALEPGRLKGGDLVELIGRHQGVDDIAGHAGTIGYEMLTALGRRFHRVYRGETV